MKINLVINEKIDETTLTIETNQITDEISELLKLIENYKGFDKIIAIKDDKKYILEVSKIVRFFSQDKKVYATYSDEEYIIKNYLYELEEKLDNNKFIRISNSEIMNLDYIESFDTSFGGSIRIKTKTGIFSYVSRGYLKRFKEILNV
ncbi:LytTR family DNA-binding domain-containing protein [Oceanivirga salmonicida]|uniref:LytTR family DNA-binding domain-containing protein n=1 Tax=Oceanivirga salmonicida TaxID=1769291 RepID=UPI00082BAFBC|nr:LytTR family DNA-binding domain-containing protein [Oceanivirga salmonicida]